MTIFSPIWSIVMQQRELELLPAHLCRHSAPEPRRGNCASASSSAISPRSSMPTSSRDAWRKSAAGLCPTRSPNSARLRWIEARRVEQREGEFQRQPTVEPADFQTLDLVPPHPTLLTEAKPASGVAGAISVA